jgi:hypothetical protein
VRGGTASSSSPTIADELAKRLNPFAGVKESTP